MLNIDRTKIEIPYETTWWGSDCTCDPRFVTEALGNGDMLVGIQPLNTRPNYYVIRVDSSWHLQGCRECEGDCPDELVEHIDEITDSIEDEYGEVGQIREFNEHELLNGETPDSDDWPALSEDSGVAWFSMDPEKYLADAVCEVKNA